MDNIVRTAIEYVPNDIKKEFHNAVYLRDSALNFIKNIEQIINQYEHLNKEISFFAKPLSNLGQALLHNKQILRQAIAQQYLFEQSVNKFLGRSINFAWIDTDTGEILFADETTAQKIYMQADTQASGKKRATTGKIYSSVVKNSQLSKLPNFVEENFKKLVEQRLKNHQELLEEVLSRWKENHQSVEENPWTKEHYNTVYWKHPPEGIGNFNHPIYSWSAVVNQGHISQEYINFIFNSIDNLEATDQGIGTFMMRSGGQKDTIPGIVKGDIEIQNNKNIQIAVKSGQFDTASIGPYLRVAFQIIAFYDNIQSLTVDEVEKILNNTKRYSQKVTETGRKKAQEVIENMARSTGAQVI